ncbi:MAG: hypothetical protein HYY60_02680 [Parcubacteria group bacterium]|nr:hypothetical protein [Parcubacteria group bacterium]
MNTIPKKQFIGAFFVILLLAAGLLFVNDFFGGKKTITDTGLRSSNASSFASDAQKDSDNDGLKDWEEVLWKTDPNNPDSDGDGTPDGEEVRNKRNPTKAGPNDEYKGIEESPLGDIVKESAAEKSPDDEYKSIEESPLGDIVKESAGEKSLTLTDIFARDFMSGYFALKDAGQYNNATRDKFVKTLFASIDSAPAEKKYTLANITITQKSDAETIRTYGNEIGGLLQKFYRNTSGDELQILDNAVKKEDATELRKLEPFAENYKNLAKELAGMRVPLILEDAHLGLVNGYQGTSDALSGMMTIFDDPMGGNIYIKKYQDNTELINKAFAELKNYFSRTGIRFKPEEYGYIFEI